MQKSLKSVGKFNPETYKGTKASLGFIPEW